MSCGADENVVTAWIDDPLLYNRGTTTSKIANIINRKINRADVTENKSLLLATCDPTPGPQAGHFNPEGNLPNLFDSHSTPGKA